MEKMPSYVSLLLEKLKNTPPGAIEREAKHKIIRLLAACWPELQGADETAMEARKLDRAEDVSWAPPILAFTLERHGATVLGSSRAALHQWSVNLQERTARVQQGRHRQLTRTAPRLDVRPIVVDVCEAVQQGPASQSNLVKTGVVEWKANDRVSIKHGKLIPNNTYQQTVAGRRRRFRKELEKRMLTMGWQLESVQHSMTFRAMTPT